MLELLKNDDAPIILEFASVLTSGIGVILVVWVFRSEHRREKQHQTLNFLLQIRPLWHDALKNVENTWGAEKLNDRDLDGIFKDPSQRQGIRTLLGYLEQLCTSVNMGVLDKQVVRRGSATHLVNIHDRLSGYIERVQRENPKAYKEFCELVQEFKKH